MTREMLFALALGYLLGSIPFGLVLTRLTGKGDIRKIGSGNIGATNVLRTGSKPLAAATLLLDCLKATAAILLAEQLLARYANLRGCRRAHRPPVPGLAWVPGRQGRRHLVRNPHCAALAGGNRLRDCVASRASDDPNLVGCGNRRSHQRAARCTDFSLVIIPIAARFCGVGAVEAPQKHPPPEEGNRATHWEAKLDRGLSRPSPPAAHARHRPRHISPVDRSLRDPGGRACRCTRSRAARRRQGARIAHPRRR